MVWGSVAVVAILAVSVVGYAWWLHSQQLSDGIFALGSLDAAWMSGVEAQENGTSLGLKKNLRQANVVVPDRPHDPKEVPTPEMVENFQRRRSFSISTNANGLRVPDPLSNSDSVEEVGPKHSFRIVCMGASVSFGWGLSYEESFPALLAQQLNVEVLNAAAPAGVPDGLVRWAEQNLDALDPDLVIFSLRPNYARPDPIGGFAQDMKKLQQIAGAVPLVVTLPPLSSFDFQLQDMERLYHGRDMAKRDYRAVKEAIAPIPVLELTETFRQAQYNSQPSSSQETLVLFHKMPQNHQLIQLPNRQIFLDVPVQHVEGRPKEPGLFDFLSAEEPQQNMIAPEILAALEQNQYLREPLFFDGGHPDSSGHILYAKTVARWLQEQRLFAPSQKQ